MHTCLLLTTFSVDLMTPIDQDGLVYAVGFDLLTVFDLKNNPNPAIDHVFASTDGPGSYRQVQIRSDHIDRIDYFDHAGGLSHSDHWGCFGLHYPSDHIGHPGRSVRL